MLVKANECCKIHKYYSEKHFFIKVHQLQDIFNLNATKTSAYNYIAVIKTFHFKKYSRDILLFLMPYI